LTPSVRAEELAAVTGKDARLVEAILAESTEVLRAKLHVIVVRHRLGYVMAQAGVDRSNVGGTDRVLLLPESPDESAGRAARRACAADRRRARRRDQRQLRASLASRDDQHCARRRGGAVSLWDRRGELDRDARPLESTEVAWADAVAAAAGLAMGEAAEGKPCVLVRGLKWDAPEAPAQALLRPIEEDMFR
jgi:coenzyme F420-0:L-glutamate ligase/coenzyme F420-1:gamma-L-glutamate ligase